MSALPIIFKSTEIILESETCIACGVIFAMPRQLRQRRLEDHGEFYCPNGHGQRFIGKTEAEKLRDQLAREQNALAIERSLRLGAERREVRLRNRVARGVCPRCKRSFQNLRQHMETKHPEEGKKKATMI